MKAEFIATEINVININQEKYWPKTDPRGTPATELFLDEIRSLADMCCLRSVSKIRREPLMQNTLTP